MSRKLFHISGYLSDDRTICASLALCTGNVCLKSPERMMFLPPKLWLVVPRDVSQTFVQCFVQVPMSHSRFIPDEETSFPK